MVLEEKKKSYINDVYAEMKKRGFTSAEIPMVIGKNWFYVRDRSISGGTASLLYFRRSR